MMTATPAMFLAPDGALQFEIRAFLTGDAPDEPFPVWVLPPRRLALACGCRTGFPVIVESLPKQWRHITEEQIRRRITYSPCVCACLGQVIE